MKMTKLKKNYRILPAPKIISPGNPFKTGKAGIKGKKKWNFL